jgi:hypothetical protein
VSVMTEYEHEPVRGLPGYLPPGEEMVWQGAPDWRVMARRVFHLRAVSIYFAIIIGAHFATQLSRGAAPVDILLGSTWQLALGGTAIAILAALARAYSRATVYTLTNKRLVIRSGVAVTTMINIPLEIVVAADLRSFAGDSGDILLTLNQRKKMSYLMLWPNVRSWHFKPVQPALRSLADVHGAAAALASVVDASSAASTDERASHEHVGAPAVA